MYEVYAGFLKEDIQLTIDGQRVSCPPESSILEAARLNGIEIPTLCYLKGLTATGACGICAVEIIEDGKPVIRRACRYRAKDGMVVRTVTPEVIAYRRERLTEILDKHPNDCLTCAKTGGNCQLQLVSQLLDVNPCERKIRGKGIDDSSPAMIRDLDKCIACGRCVNVCNEVQRIGIYEMKYDEATGDKWVDTKKDVKLNATACINCGQCVKVCPVGALTEKDGIQKTLAALADPNTTVVWQMAPAIQNTLGEEFCMPAGTDVTKKIAAAMHRLGGYAFTTDFTADLTIMEEGTEFIGRVTKGGVLPMMTSCCPGWIKHMEYNYPDQLDHLSSCKSPQQMFGALVKNFLPEKIGVAKENIFHVSIMPCVAKKYEAGREEMNGDVDVVLTTREMAKLLRLKGINRQASPTRSSTTSWAKAPALPVSSAPPAALWKPLSGLLSGSSPAAKWIPSTTPWPVVTRALRKHPSSSAIWKSRLPSSTASAMSGPSWKTSVRASAPTTSSKSWLVPAAA